MNMRVRVNRSGETLRVVSPYNPDMNKIFRRLGGTFDRETTAWVLPASIEKEVREKLMKKFGDDGEQDDRVNVRIRAKGDLEGWQEPIFYAGRIVAQARGRDSGAKPGDQVSLVSGTINSGGSVKNWETRVREGAEFVVQDMPRGGAVDDPEFEMIEIIERAPDPAELRAERERLTRRLDEIDTALAEL